MLGSAMVYVQIFACTILDAEALLVRIILDYVII